MRDIFVLERTGMDRHGRIQGKFAATGVQPYFLERLKAHGVRLAASTFTEVQELKES
jgi:pilus assembly protein CpaF